MDATSLPYLEDAVLAAVTLVLWYVQHFLHIFCKFTWDSRLGDALWMWSPWFQNTAITSLESCLESSQKKKIKWLPTTKYGNGTFLLSWILQLFQYVHIWRFVSRSPWWEKTCSVSLSGVWVTPLNMISYSAYIYLKCSWFSYCLWLNSILWWFDWEQSP